jgi:hypothetical protein
MATFVLHCLNKQLETTLATVRALLKTRSEGSSCPFAIKVPLQQFLLFASHLFNVLEDVSPHT